MGRERVVIRGIGLHVEGDDFLAPGDDHGAHSLRQGEGLDAATAVFGRVEDLNWNCVMMRLKEPLSFLAARSALAMIHPVDDWSHKPPPLSGRKKQCIDI